MKTILQSNLLDPQRRKGPISSLSRLKNPSFSKLNLAMKMMKKRKMTIVVPVSMGMSQTIRVILISRIMRIMITTRIKKWILLLVR